MGNILYTLGYRHFYSYYMKSNRSTGSYFTVFNESNYIFMFPNNYYFHSPKQNWNHQYHSINSCNTVLSHRHYLDNFKSILNFFSCFCARTTAYHAKYHNHYNYFTTHNIHRWYFYCTHQASFFRITSSDTALGHHDCLNSSNIGHNFGNNVYNRERKLAASLFCVFKLCFQF